MKPYSLWIPVRNEEATIEPLIISVLEQENPPENIYVCVNGSSDRTGEIVYEISQQCRQVIPLTSSPWKANAWNTIVQTAVSDGTFEDVMVFCDGDISFGGPKTLSTLVQHTRASTNNIVGGSIFPVPSRNRIRPCKLCTPSGWLYCIQKTILELLEKHSYWKMPNNIINEDLFLSLLAYPDVDVITDAFFYAVKPDLRDYIITQIRILKWMKQLVDMGMWAELEIWIDRVLQSWGVLRTLKYGYIVPLMMSMITVSPSDHVWTITSSTKKLV